MNKPLISHYLHLIVPCTCDIQTKPPYLQCLLCVCNFMDFLLINHKTSAFLKKDIYTLDVMQAQITCTFEIHSSCVIFFAVLISKIYV